MTETDFIAQQQAMCTARLQHILRKIDNTGWAGRKTIEFMLAAGMIEFSGPRPEISNPYNCYRLTDAGKEVVA